jgi:hypothetical protein
MPPSRFPRGSTAYSKDGRTYIVDVAEDGIVYCTSDNGAETEFPESSLLNEKEWASRAGNKREVSYNRLRQSKAFTAPTGKIARADAEKLLAKVQRVSPSLLDFTAFTVASRLMIENKEQNLLPDLSIVKCRAMFDEAAPDIRACLLANVLGVKPDVLISASNLGDNLMRAMVDKGLSEHGAAFEDFSSRRRR